ncbi:MAG: hypothetical protein ACWGNO_12995 [Desulfobacterales bacterium]
MKKIAKLWVTVYPISRRLDLCGALASGLLDFLKRAKLLPKRVRLNKLLDFDGKKYL